MSMYIDETICPKGHTFRVQRRQISAGWEIPTTCPMCKKQYAMRAGPVPYVLTSAGRPLIERDIEARLVRRVREVGGEVRKVQWVGRRGAPDRLVMLPPRRVSAMDHTLIDYAPIWVELKAPGGAALFPRNAHERAQHREHERMRKLGQRVEVIDSYEQIEGLLK